jgi:ATP-dependent DNA helicase RecQ
VPDLLSLLKTHFGYDQFRPLQQEIISSVLAGKDALVLMPTGAGKSLCYQLPALCCDGLTVVVSPLIALMKDQVDALKANGIAAEFINSTLSFDEIARVQAQARMGQVKILYLAPERLALAGFRGFLQELKVSLIAIDEAHCISEWGHDFRPDYLNLKTLRRDFPSAPMVALTATATERVRQDIIAQLELRKPQVFISSFNRANLTYLVQRKRKAFETLLALLRKHQNESALVYCFSRKDTEGLAADLRAEGFNALPYHAGLENSVRRETQEKFIRDEAPIVVATIAFGMGIDKPDIRLVVHYDLPKSIEGYYQETGRAGRDGLPSECVLLYSYGDKIKQEFFIDQIEDAIEQSNARQKLAQMIEFCELQTCRRRFLLEYFGERWESDGCGNCDVCLTPVEEFDATVVAQKVLSAVVRTGQRFGANHVIAVLRGKRIRRIEQLRHNELSVYGIVDDFSDDELKHVIGLLVTKGLLAKEEQYGVLSVTPDGWTFIRQRRSLTLARPKPAVEARSAAESDEIAYDRALFEKLRALRKRLADARGVPPYVVFGDAALQDMARYLPQSPQSLLRISGVGPAKLSEFGDVFLSVISAYAEENGLLERSIPSRQSDSAERRRRERERDRRTRSEGSTYDETKKLLAQKLSISEMAEQRGLSHNTIISHLERLAMAGEELDIQHLLPPPERVAKIKAAFQQFEEHYLTPVRELLGEDYSYDELRLVRLWLRQSQGVVS